MPGSITVTDYKSLRELVRRRRIQLGLSQLALDERAGLQSGYTGKIEAGIRNFGETSLPCLLGALGIVLQPVLAAGKQSELALRENEKYELSRKTLSAKGGRARSYTLTPKQRMKIAKQGAKARWARWKAERERGGVRSMTGEQPA